ncbi:MAG: iron complex outermembrane receptor protein [Zhongshania sp.]
MFALPVIAPTTTPSNPVVPSLGPSTLKHPSNGQYFAVSDKPFDGVCGTTHISNVENSGFSLTAEYDLSETTTLKYVFAKREGETQQFIDFDGTPLDAFDVPAKYADDQKSHELQLNDNIDRLAVVAGLYYSPVIQRAPLMWS